jgi:hypothetical protein
MNPAILEKDHLPSVLFAALQVDVRVPSGFKNVSLPVPGSMPTDLTAHIAVGDCPQHNGAEVLFDLPGERHLQRNRFNIIRNRFDAVLIMNTINHCRPHDALTAVINDPIVQIKFYSFTFNATQIIIVIEIQ